MQPDMSEVANLKASYQQVKAKGSTTLLTVWPCSCDKGKLQSKYLELTGLLILGQVTV